MSRQVGSTLAAALDEAAATRPDPRRGCGTGKWLATLEPADRAAMEAAFDSDLYSGALLGAFIRDHGGTASDLMVRRHRKGECGCPR